MDAGDPVEYWKSAPHILHFMREYQLKQKLEEVADDPPPKLRRALRKHRKRLLARSRVDAYEEIDPANGRLRALLRDMVDPGQWELLWVHPCVPYMEPGGAYARIPEFTKALVFSSWTVVPDTLAAMCSYEVERRIVARGGEAPRYHDLSEAQRPLLRFVESRGRLTGMPALALMYPSVSLSQAVDPLRLSLELGEGRPAAAEEVRRRAEAEVEGLLRKTGLWPRGGDGPSDRRWYWAALAILDRPYWKGIRTWVRRKGWREALSVRDEDKGLRRHIEAFASAGKGDLDDELGPAPDDLVRVLAEFALAGPAICAARALRRIAPGLEAAGERLLGAAAGVASGFRTLFNVPETILLLRDDDEGAYWRRVLEHGLDGNLQAVLDEYAHMLRESLGLADHEDQEVADAVAAEMADALSIRAGPVFADDIGVGRSGPIRFERFQFRSRYALKFGELRDDQDKTLARADTVRSAFNSPFRPFVLATTSIGQEGLDFHTYCHAVYHWNLPPNPVDMEQREGRVHRFKGHAVRKNVAREWGLTALRERFDGGGDPWEALFRTAVEARGSGVSDLVPYWIYEIDGGAHVERRIPMFPLSREVGRLARLQKGLAVYRLAFGQPRQEDLVAFLAGRDVDARGMEISLEPPASR